jgi:hypothetical protein
MRVLTVLSLVAVVCGSRVCEAGLSTAPRDEGAPTASHATVARHGTADRHRGHRRAHHARGFGNPITAVGGAIGGLFRR